MLTYDLAYVQFDHVKKKYIFPNGDELFGIVLVRVLPNLTKYPFLLYRTSTAHSTISLCKLCAEKGDKGIESMCNHSEW